jgi:DNA-binding MarR family transcriptional regulator
MPLIEMPGDYLDQTPDADPRATEAVMNTMRTADLLFERIGRLLRPLGVSAAGGLVLGLLRDRGPLSPSELGERLIVTRATVTGLVDSLERRGLATRAADPGDRRRQIISITPDGLRVVQQVREIVHREETAWFAAFSAEEVTTYIGLLHRIQQRITGEGPEPAAVPGGG